MKRQLAAIAFLLLASGLFFTACQRSEEPNVTGSPSVENIDDSDTAVSDVSQVFQPTDTREWFERLRDRMVNKHIGGGEYEIKEGELGYDIYLNSVNGARRMADSALSNFSSYQIVVDGDGQIEDAIPLENKNFNQLMKDFYGLGLALHIYPTKETEAKARAFIKWLQWANFQPEDMNHWYLATLGRSFLLFHGVLDDSDLDFAISHLFGSEHDEGKGLINKIIHIARNGSDGYNDGMRNADVLRAHGEFVFCGVLLLPDTTEEELSYKEEKWLSVLDSISYALTPSPGIRGFLKPDYTGSHHFYAYTSAYVSEAALSLAAMVQFLKETPWQFRADQLEWLQGYVQNLFFYSHHDHVPLGLSGRFFSNDSNAKRYELLPVAVWLNDEPDPELLQVFANTYREDLATTYNPTYRLNQVGFPAYSFALAKSLQEVERLGIEPEVIEGVRSYPFMPGMAKRRDNWVAFVKGMNNYFWSYEGGITATNPQAIFGIYKSHGALEIRYIDPKNPTSGDTVNPLLRKGMDMSHRSGATVPYRTDEDMINDQVDSRLQINSTAVGGAELDEEWGVFMFDLANTPKQMKDRGFRARKSYFFFRDYIVMIGDSIESDGEYPIYTTLFQTDISQSDPQSDPIFVNSAIPVTQMDYETVVSSTLRGTAIVDTDSTGYYIPAGERVNVSIKEVDWRVSDWVKGQRGGPERQEYALNLPSESAFRAIAWIDHGRNPAGSNYEYAIMPGVNYEKMAQLRDLQDDGKIYRVIENSDRAHIVYDNIQGVWSYALYSDYESQSDNPLKAVSIAEALPHESENVRANEGYAVILRTEGDLMDLSVSYLDLRMREGFRATFGSGPTERLDNASAPIILSVTVEGNWQLDEINPAVVGIETEGSTTRLLIRCQNGISQKVSLSRAF
ncbi:polysaccharide lyase family 8 super-sandwich domain-containing protein [Rubellicoccus peritrichatus]|uniref:Polysaccharide lyase family 8 super-sandwich domain-containing protein n=1 Tax=Rubellicoccus peritrichatus TaxID=3080537 RepID=A0AAQ3L9Z3_9BACT|nr:polysaccharide lyase family 8 super-sandwich domain-containing protein [Puniceicoccus sp. CR14]WOO39613.1 polysaccharide lyase family 8 super-sandwich domain-containing protein [Puniceicoccus sp. CR14]